MHGIAQRLAPLILKEPAPLAVNALVGAARRGAARHALLDALLIEIAGEKAPEAVNALLLCGAKTGADDHAAVRFALPHADNLRVMLLHGVKIERAYIAGRVAQLRHDRHFSTDEEKAEQARYELETRRSTLDRAYRDAQREAVQVAMKKEVAKSSALSTPFGQPRAMA
jgi:hypothetical protein